MEFHIADIFTVGLARPTGERQKALKTTAQGQNERRRLGHAQQ